MAILNLFPLYFHSVTDLFPAACGIIVVEGVLLCWKGKCAKVIRKILGYIMKILLVGFILWTCFYLTKCALRDETVRLRQVFTVVNAMVFLIVWAVFRKVAAALLEF